MKEGEAQQGSPVSQELQDEIKNLPMIMGETAITCIEDADKIVRIIQEHVLINDKIDEAMKPSLKAADLAHKTLKKTIDGFKAASLGAVEKGKALLISYHDDNPDFQEGIKGLSIGVKEELIIPDDDDFLYLLFGLVVKKKLPIGVFTVNNKTLQELHNMGSLKLQGIVMETKDKKSVTVRRE